MSTSSGSSVLSQLMSGRSSKRQSLSTIESSVTRLLVSTKHLLESLTQWARQEADDKFVSDAYVKLGNDFRAASRAFTTAGVDITDIGDVPQALRIILEAALSEAPSQANLDRFLPNIRNIIVTLLQNLKAKQVKAKSLSQEKGRKVDQIESIPKPEIETSNPPVAANVVVPSLVEAPKHIKKPSSSSHLNPAHIDQNNALAQLQNGFVLERRASKRFSAYQYAKLTSHNVPNVLPKITSGPTGSRQPSIQGDESYDSTYESVNENKESDKTANIFLKIHNKTKKATIGLPVTFASLRLLFVEKFAYSPGTASFPDIYIQDPNNHISYELEDHLLDEVKPGSLLSLNEPDLLASILKDLESKFHTLSTKFDTMNSDLSSQIKSAIESIEFPQPMAPPAIPESNALPKPATSSSLRELASIQHDLKVIRQIQGSNKEIVRESVAKLMLRVKDFQEAGLDVSKSSNRAYMDSCHTKLSEESDMLLTKVDDLQDIMEALRKDVAQRGVRVGEKQLKNTYKEITDANNALKSMSGYIATEKSVWKKIWEAELDKVCEEQQFFNLQEDLTHDLEDDINKIEETFTLIEQCSSEQSKQSAYKRNKVVAQLHIPEPGESLHNLKDAVLNEVIALRPNHESRLEAIERAERLRERERELMKLTQFQEELGEFVDDNKLKKSGGIDELERMRRARDSENLKSSFGVI